MLQTCQKGRAQADDAAVWFILPCHTDGKKDRTLGKLDWAHTKVVSAWKRSAKCLGKQRMQQQDLTISKSNYTEHIARISFGKDSLKMLDVIITRGLPLDRVTTTDVWATDTVRAELPDVLIAKERIEEKLWQMYRIEVDHLCARNKDGTKRTYEQMFYHVPVRRSQTVQVESRTSPAQCVRGDSSGIPNYRVQGSITGFPPNTGYNYCQNSKLSEPHIKGWPLANGKLTWCQKLKIRVQTPRFPSTDLQLVQKLKIDYVRDPFPASARARGAEKNIVEYLGIAADEPDRFGQLSEWKRAPLEEFGIEENLCGLYCQYKDMLLPSYETSCRDGCWFCHNQGVNQLRNLWRNYPDHWAMLMKWDLDSPVTFKADGHTVHDFDRRFQMEVERKIPMDRTFRWAMLDKPPAFVPYRGEQLSIPTF